MRTVNGINYLSKGSDVIKDTVSFHLLLCLLCLLYLKPGSPQGQRIAAKAIGSTRFLIRI